MRETQGESNTRAVDALGSVSEKDMLRYTEDGFRLVAKRLFPTAISAGGQQTSGDGVNASVIEDLEEDDTAETGFIKARRIAYIDGFEYATTYNTTALVVSPRGERLSSQLHRPTPRNVIGEDERTLVSNTTVYPYSAMGQLEFGNGTFCSGTVISRNAILTAAHCVYDMETNEWFQLHRFTPGRFRADDRVEDPFGEWYPTSATVYQAYKGAVKSKHRFNYDYAVVLLAPREDGCTFIGDVVGFAGIRKTELGEKSLNDATINGYPQDMAYGSMWSTGNCYGDAFDCLQLDHYVCYYCDTAGGLSGAAILDSENYVIGVHTNWFKRFGKPIYNGGALIDTDWRLQNTIDWSQRALQLPVCDARNKTVPTKSGSLKGATPSKNVYNHCFPSHAQVDVKGKGTVALYSLEIGDFVLARNGQYALVYSLAHFDRDSEAIFVQVTLDGIRGNVFEITAGHLLFIHRAGTIQARAASTLRVGDELIDASGSTVKVIEITSVVRRGVFAPFTTTGDIVVNGILASTYATVNGRDRLPETIPYQLLAHILVTPRRLYCRWIRCENEVYTDEGIARWLVFYYWIVQQRSELQFLFVLGVTSAALPIYIVETAMLHTFVLERFALVSLVFLLFGLWNGIGRQRKQFSLNSDSQLAARGTLQAVLIYPRQ